MNSMLGSLSPIARAILPVQTFERMRAISSRRYQVKLFKRLGLVRAAGKFVNEYGSTVRNGPFKGLVYPREAALNRHIIPKLLGTYEQELHGVLEIVSRRKYDCIIDVGSAEGYYAVGLARLTGIPVYAFDPEPIEKRFCSEMARLNRVSHLVTIQDFFSPSDVPRFTGKRVLMISDCEGFETQIFTQATLESMAGWDVIVELHGAAQKLLPALSWPGSCRVIATESRVGLGFSELAQIPGADSAALLNEYRGGEQSWLWCDSQVQ